MSDEWKREIDKLATLQLPRPCEYDHVMMITTGRGIRCPKCGHEVFDVLPESRRASKPETCYCFNCYEKRQSTQYKKPKAG